MPKNNPRVELFYTGTALSRYQMWQHIMQDTSGYNRISYGNHNNRITCDVKNLEMRSRSDRNDIIVAHVVYDFLPAQQPMRETTLRVSLNMNKIHTQDSGVMLRAMALLQKLDRDARFICNMKQKEKFIRVTGMEKKLRAQIMDLPGFYQP